MIVSFERFGIEDSDEFFEYRAIFLKHGVTLLSTEADEGDLTAKDQMTMLKIVFKAEGSRDEQRKKGNRSISGKFARITQFKTYQGGPIPYGYEKECRNPAGELLWTLRYEAPGKRVQVMPNGTTTRFDGDKDTHPQKARYDIIRLVPSTDPERVENVSLIYDLWVNRDITILGICKHLNALGRTHYGDPRRSPLSDHEEGVRGRPEEAGRRGMGEQASSSPRPPAAPPGRVLAPAVRPVRALQGQDVRQDR